MPLSPRFARHFPRSRGQLTTQEERIRIFIIYKYAFSIISCRILRYHPSYCGSVLLICILPPLKNDGTGELRSGVGLNTGLSFLNEVMASEPFFKERSDAVQMSETPYPTNGSGKNPGRACKI